MEQNDTFMYDENLDRLMIFNNLKDDEIIFGSVNILNLVIDFTTKNKIANIEIKNVTEYLKSLDVDPKILDKLTNAKIRLTQMRGGFLLQLLLCYNKGIEKIPFNIATEEEMLITV